MIAGLKLTLGPFLGSAYLLASVPAFSTVGAGAAIFGVAVLIGGVAVVARYKAMADLGERERKLYMERDVRLTQDNHDLATRIGELEARPNLQEHANLLAAIRDEMRAMSEELREHTRHSETEFVRRAAHDEQMNLVLGSIAERLNNA